MPVVPELTLEIALYLVIDEDIRLLSRIVKS